MMKNDEELPRKHLGSVTEAPRLGFFPFFLFSSLISSENSVQEMLNNLNSTPSPIFFKKKIGLLSDEVFLSAPPN